MRRRQRSPQHGCTRCESLERAVADAQQAQAEAELTAHQACAEKHHAWQHVDRLTRRLTAIDADQLRGERDDLLLENASLRARLALGDRSELARARETIACLDARLAAAERGAVAP
ncbi:hypothetical protein ACIBKY_03780 [Nonomuraea sp. NPDC050394]|uniref:hypothetical protein n=1 Tax=Nonomuraea sp. NPDC050394 TaxID=3364363 RepID=UPI0037B5B5CF